LQKNILKNNMDQYDLVIVGGGAAGFFAAINSKEKNPSLKIAIIEKNKDVLQKVKVSGGGRCNVTNSCVEPQILINNYPRGHNYLLESFEKFGPEETIKWFKNRGVGLKTEKDGRIFPVSDSSETIINNFKSAINNLGISIYLSERVSEFRYSENIWAIKTEKGLDFTSKNLMIATGSDNRIWQLLKNLGLSIIEPVPSLFTFTIPDAELRELQGLSFDKVAVHIKNKNFSNQGPFLITHWGVSGPAVLKLSAWAARELQQCEYKFEIEINWLFDKTTKQVLSELKENINLIPKKNVISNPMFGFSARFWKYLCQKININENLKWAEIGKKNCIVLAEIICQNKYQVDGKSTFKEEFVTAGGIDLDEINLETFSSKKIPNLYFSGEVLNIDAITGGFNFQAAWTGSWIVSESLMSQK
jgi:predicted Rossmann fold flavoprotein